MRLPLIEREGDPAVGCLNALMIAGVLWLAIALAGVGIWCAVKGVT